MNTNLSVHLQNFPDVSFLSDEKNLVSDMDMVRAICGAALFIRDSRNLRVRLPLQQLNIIGKNAEKMLQYQDIIADEVNVKNIKITPEIGDLAEIKLQINFKKIGAKLGNKIKDITLAAKSNQWQKIADNKIKIADEILTGDEFEVKLITKNPLNTTALPSNDCLVELDINLTKELEDEGLARDIIRLIQQNRKDANLDIADHIKIVLNSANTRFLEVVKTHQNYIQEQTLSAEILTNQPGSKLPHHFNNKIEDTDLEISFDVVK